MLPQDELSPASRADLGGYWKKKLTRSSFIAEIWNSFPDVFKVEHVNNQVSESAISLKAIFSSVLLYQL